MLSEKRGAEQMSRKEKDKTKEIVGIYMDSLQPDRMRKQETLMYLQAQRRKLILRPRKTFRERLLDQISWLSPGMWIGQAAVLLCFCLLIKETGWHRRDTLLIMAGCTPLFGVTGLIELLRSFRSGMWELEECCRYNLRQIQAMRLLLFGLADSAATVLIFCLGMLEGYTADLLLLFFLFPLLVSDSVLLLLAGKFRRRAGSVVSVAAGIFLGFFWMYEAAWLQDVPGVLEKHTSPGALMLYLLSAMMFLAFGCIRFINETGREEEKSWNYG